MINLKRVADAIVNGQEVDWKTVRHQHVAFGEGGGLIAGNPKVFLGVSLQIKNHLQII